MWDYPRPPRVEPRPERVIVRLGGQVIADTTDAVRVLETSHPPVYYLPLDAFPAGVLVPVEGTSFCEFKGEAHYFDVVAGGVVVPREGGPTRSPPGVRGAQDPGGPLPAAHGLLRDRRPAGDLPGG